MSSRRVLLLALCACGVTPLDQPLLRHTTASLDLGNADCGGDAPAADWTLDNDGQDPLDVTATADAPFEVRVDDVNAQTQHFFVAPQSSRTVRVVAPAAAANAMPNKLTTGALHVTTNDSAAASFDVALTTVTHGALLQFVPSKMDLGMIPVNVKSPPQNFTLENVGNADADFDLVPIANPDFQITLSATHLSQQGSAQGMASFFASAPGDTKATASLVAHGPVCGDAAKLDVLATGGEGMFGFSPGWLDFGGVYCGDTAAPQTMTLLNGGNASYKFTASFANGTSFQVSPSSGVVSTSTVLTITPLPIPAVSSTSYGAFNDKLVITTDIPDDPPHEVNIIENARGAVLHFAPQSNSFGAVQVGQDAVHAVQLVNDGNESISFSAAASGDFALDAGQAGWGSNWVNVTFHPQPALLGQKEQASLTPATTGHLCAPPPTLMVDATNHDQAESVVALDDATCVQTWYPRRLYCWGSNAAQQLGTNQVTGALTPRYVDLTSYNIYSNQIIGGGGTFVAAYGGAVTWGTLNGVTYGITQSNWDGSASYASPLVACSNNFGFLECVGKGGYLGNGSTTDTTTLAWNSVRPWAWFETGYDGHTCAYGDRNNGVYGLYCFGPDDWGQLGDGNSGSSQPVADATIAAIDPSYQTVGAGDGFTCAYSYQNQDVLCWGRNTSSECGLAPSSSPVLTPNTVATGKATRLDAGRDFICADAGASVRCWGSNSNGQLGDGGQEATSATPVTVPLAKSSNWMSAANRHACVVLFDGRVQCWGSNSYGELGDGTTTDAFSPVFVKGFD